MAQCLSHRNNYLVNHLRDIVKVDETFLDSPISDADFLDGIATVNSARVPKINRQEVFMFYLTTAFGHATISRNEVCAT